MRIAIYSRKSKFTGKGESIDNQIQLCREYADKYIDGYKEFYVYEDEGFSGGNVRRPEFQKMMDDIKNKKIDALMCYRLDRISRNISDFSDTIKLLEQYKVQFISIKEQFDTSTPMGRAMLYISSVFAQLERETIAERIKDNMYELAKTGRWLGGTTPHGFDSKKVLFGEGKSMFVLIDNIEEQETMKLFYKKYHEFSNLTKVRYWIVKNGYKTRKNTDFANINRMFCNPVYAIPDEDMYDWLTSQGSFVCSSKNDFLNATGIISYGKQYDNGNGRGRFKGPEEWVIAVSDSHTGIIPGKEWVATYDLMKGNKKFPQRPMGKVGMLIGLLKCSCGSGYKIAYASHDRARRLGVDAVFYYVCIKRERTYKEKCNVKYLNGINADEEILKILKGININKQKLRSFIKGDLSKIDSNAKATAKERTRIEKEKAKIDNIISNLTKQLSGSSNSSAGKYIIKSIEENDKKLQELNRQLLDLDIIKDSKSNVEEQIEMIIDNIHTFVTEFETLDLQAKKRILKIIFKEITWDGETLEVKFL